MPRRPKAAQGGFESPPGRRRRNQRQQEDDLHVDTHRHGTAPVVYRFAQPDVARRLSTETAPKYPTPGTRPDRPPRGAKENQ